MKKFIKSKIDNARHDLEHIFTTMIHPTYFSRNSREEYNSDDKLMDKNIEIIRRWLETHIGFKVDFIGCDLYFDKNELQFEVTVVSNIQPIQFIVSIDAQEIHHPSAIVQILEPEIHSIRSWLKVPFDNNAQKQFTDNVTTEFSSYVNKTHLISEQFRDILPLIAYIDGESYRFNNQFDIADEKISFFVSIAGSISDPAVITFEDTMLYDETAYKKLIVDLCILSHEWKQYRKTKKNLRKLKKAISVVSDYNYDVVPVVSEPQTPTMPVNKIYTHSKI